MGFTKLDEGILQSSVMAESPETFKVWIAMIAACRENGVAKVSPVYLSSVCRLPIEDVEKALEVLSGPDKHSRSTNDDGRRIIRVDGGFEIINYKKYRAFTGSDSTGAIRQRRYRERKCVASNGEAVTSRNKRNALRCNESDGNTSASASASVVLGGGTGGGESVTGVTETVTSPKRKKKAPLVFVPPSFTEVIAFFAENGYPKELATRFFKGYETAEWKDSRGNQIRNWKQKAIMVWFKNNEQQSHTQDTGRSVEDIYGKPLNSQSDY